MRVFALALASLLLLPDLGWARGEGQCGCGHHSTSISESSCRAHMCPGGSHGNSYAGSCGGGSSGGTRRRRRRSAPARNYEYERQQRERARKARERRERERKAAERRRKEREAEKRRKFDAAKADLLKEIGAGTEESGIEEILGGTDELGLMDLSGGDDGGGDLGLMSLDEPEPALPTWESFEAAEASLKKRIMALGKPYNLRRKPKIPDPNSSNYAQQKKKYEAELKEYLKGKAKYEKKMAALAEESRGLEAVRKKLKPKPKPSAKRKPAKKEPVQKAAKRKPANRAECKDSANLIHLNTHCGGGDITCVNDAQELLDGDLDDCDELFPRK